MGSGFLQLESTLELVIVRRTGKLKKNILIQC
jgi:hypothetical protein